MNRVNKKPLRHYFLRHSGFSHGAGRIMLSIGHLVNIFQLQFRNTKCCDAAFFKLKTCDFKFLFFRHTLTTFIVVISSCSERDPIQTFSSNSDKILLSLTIAKIERLKNFTTKTKLVNFKRH